MTEQYTATGHIVGHTYISSYWKETYTVIEELSDHEGNKAIRVIYGSGIETIHITDRGDDKDITVIPAFVDRK